MKKRIFLTLALLAAASCAFAKTGIGAQLGYTAGQDGMGGALTFKFESLPCVFAANASFSDDYFSFGGTADWWFGNPKLADPISYFYGLGVGAGLSTSDSASAFGIGPRALIGLNAMFANDFFEIYVQAAWQPMIWIGASDAHSGGGFDIINFPINLGFRLWF